jgi:hypothetical protein
MTAIRRRTAYGCICIVIIAFGLIWRLAPLGLPPFLFKYGGSVAWGAMVYFLLAAVSPWRRLPAIAAASLFVATAVELSRLYHTPWLDAFRSTLAGALLLGKHFSLWDIVAYYTGTGVAATLDIVTTRRNGGRLRS